MHTRLSTFALLCVSVAAYPANLFNPYADVASCAKTKRYFQDNNCCDSDDAATIIPDCSDEIILTLVKGTGYVDALTGKDGGQFDTPEYNAHLFNAFRSTYERVLKLEEQTVAKFGASACLANNVSKGCMFERMVYRLKISQAEYGTAEFYYNTFANISQWNAWIAANHPGNSPFFGWQTAGHFKYFFKDTGHHEYLFHTDFANTSLSSTTDFGEYIERGYYWAPATSAQKQNVLRIVGNFQSPSYVFHDMTAALNALPLIIADEYLFLQMTGWEAWMSVVGNVPDWFGEHLLHYFNSPLDEGHKLLIVNPPFSSRYCPS